MLKTLKLKPHLVATLPETSALISSGNLTVHPAVSRVTLHGSRGLAGGYRRDSDIDLSLLVDLPQAQEMEGLLREVLDVTLTHWQGAVELDLAVIFDIKNCKLACFEKVQWDEQFCPVGGVDCFGLYKTQKGFNGFGMRAGIQVRLMYPCLKIWQRE
jgi:hypothetical protein